MYTWRQGHWRGERLHIVLTRVLMYHHRHITYMPLEAVVVFEKRSQTQILIRQSNMYMLFSELNNYAWTIPQKQNLYYSRSAYIQSYIRWMFIYMIMLCKNGPSSTVRHGIISKFSSKIWIKATLVVNWCCEQEWFPVFLMDTKRSPENIMLLNKEVVKLNHF